MWTATESTFLARSWPITYSSRIDLISCGFGSGPVVENESSRSTSSAMMSLHRPMHSSQM
ncbi:hypothetical protein D3C83_91440 [compost metagenome]